MYSHSQKSWVTGYLYKPFMITGTVFAPGSSVLYKLNKNNNMTTAQTLSSGVDNGDVIEVLYCSEIGLLLWWSVD